MPEELTPDSMSDRAATDPSTIGAYWQAQDLVDKDVVDVNGQRLGRVTKCFAEEGALTRCELSLSDNVRGIHGVDQQVAGIPADWIARVDEEAVRLSHAAEEILHPSDPRPPGASHDLRGAQEKPRKNR